MRQIAANSEVSLSATFESEASQVWFTANAVGENLGWILKEENARLRTKLRAALTNWYEFAINEQDPNCCYLALYLTSGTINLNHFHSLYKMDFVNKDCPA